MIFCNVLLIFQDLVIAHTEEGLEAVVVAIVIEIEIAVQETNDHTTIIIFPQRYQPTSKPMKIKHCFLLILAPFIFSIDTKC